MSDNKRSFIKAELIRILEESLNKTLGEIDISGDFERTINNPKITGIAGDVIEHSILGYPSNSKQEPDIIVDGDETEVKTTGIKFAKAERKNGKFIYEAKEPMSITAVSPNKIVHESFEDSNFWHKLRKMLLIYYHYNSDETVTADEYANFVLKGYEFHEFSEDDKMRLMGDWLVVQDFIKELQDEYQNPEDEYPRLSSELRDKLIYIDTAPKWPNKPRFRLKRNFVSKIVRNHFGDKLEQLPQTYNTYLDIDKMCDKLVLENRGKTIKELLEKYDLLHTIHSDKKRGESVSKSIAERIIVKMFGGTSLKMSSIETFRDFCLIGKSVVLTNSGARTEDMKLFPIDFGEWCNPETEFEDSLVYDFFANHQLLCIIFQEPYNNAPLLENRFVGFKRVSFDSNFIERHVLGIWNLIRKLVNENLLEEKICISKKTNLPICNPAGTIKKTLNFPKSKDNLVFVRGGGLDSTKKTHEINGIKMYQQFIWIKGKYIASRLEEYIDSLNKQRQ